MTYAAQLKAEMILAVHLTARHRTVRLMAVLAAATLVVARGAPDRLAVLVFTACGIGAVGASRPLAPGPALDLARRAAAHPLVTAVGRLSGVALLVLAATAVALPLSAPDGLATAVRQDVLAAVLAAVALAAPILAVSPVIGASGAAGAGLVMTVLGHVPPSAVAALLAPWPMVRGGAVLCWNALPLPWRAERWAAQPATHGGDVALLVGWIVAGLACAVWVLLRTGNRGTR